MSSYSWYTCIYMYLQTVGDPEFTLIAVGVAVRPTQRDPAHGAHHVTVSGLVHTT